MVVVLVVEMVAVPLDQTYVFPPLPFSVIEVVLQVSTCVLGKVEITEVGIEISCAIVMLVVAAQPFWSRTTSEYVPGELTEIEDPVEIGLTPLAQANEPLPTAFRLIEVCVQFKIVVFEALSILTVGNELTTTEVVAGSAQRPEVGVNV